MSIYYPEATPVLGNNKVVATPSVADPEAPSLASELAAGTAVDLSLTLRDFAPTVNVNSGTAPRRLGTKTQMPQEGLSQYQPIEIRYPYNPQGDDTDPDNEAKGLLVDGAELAIVVRKGVDAETSFTVGDHVETWTVRCGRQNRTRSGDAGDEFAEEEISQMLYPIAPEGYGTVAA